MRAADLLTLSNNAYITFDGDSIYGATDGVGYRIGAIYYGIRVCLKPKRTNYVAINYRSGGDMDDRITNTGPKFLGFDGYRSNSFQHVHFSSATDNTGLNSNQMRLAQSNLCLYPGYISPGNYPLVQQSGSTWAGTHPYQWITLGNPPINNDGDPVSTGQRSGGAASAGNTFGFAGLDLWLYMMNHLYWTNDIVKTTGINIGFTSSLHIIGGGDGDMAYYINSQTTTSETNVANSMVDYATANVVWTNNCAIGNIIKSGNSISIVRQDDALPPPFFYPNGAMTNNTYTIYTLNPSDITYFNFGVGFTNLTPGLWRIDADGVTLGFATDQQLQYGFNMSTNVIGPFFNQSQQVLIRILDWFYVDHTTLIPGSAGDQIGMVTLASQANSFWSSGNRGDSLIAATDLVMTQVQTNFQSIYQAAVTTNHTLTATFVQGNGVSMPWIH